ncbi:MAG: hypothetical protein C0631_09960 [Sedimenticola sp.]|nr:MAG: hypothetical protein C0631_09960 [Sedimenticola sp.]
MTRSASDFVIGALGWDHAGWQGRYYPDDLPEEWRLSYYANDFAAVLLPWLFWADASQQRLAAWLDDVHARFRFFLEVREPERNLGELKQRLSRLLPATGGLLFDPSCSADLVDRLLDGVQNAPPCYFPVVPPEVGLAVGQCWGRATDAAESRIVLLDSASSADLRKMRGLLESLVATPPDTPPDTAPSGLFFRGDPPDTELMGEVKILSQLMGLA